MSDEPPVMDDDEEDDVPEEPLHSEFEDGTYGVEE